MSEIVGTETKRIHIQITKTSNDESERIEMLNDGLSESRKRLFSAWHSEFAKKGKLTVECEFTPEPFTVDKNNNIEPELIQIPDELAVSPSQLEDSEEEEEEKENNKVALLCYKECEKLGIIDLRQIDERTIPRSFFLQCPCYGYKSLHNVIRCMKCKTWQHLDCMMALYTDLDQRNGIDFNNMPVNDEKKIKVKKNPRLIQDISTYNSVINSHSNHDHNSTLGCNKPANVTNRLTDKPLSAITPNRYMCNLCGNYPVSIEILNNLKDEQGLESIESYSGEEKNLSSGTNNSFDQSIIEQVAASSVKKSLALHNAQNKLNECKVKAVKADTIRLETTNVNQRVPSPPRKSKRKQTIDTKFRETNESYPDGLNSPKKPYDTTSKLTNLPGNSDPKPLTSEPVFVKSNSTIKSRTSPPSYSTPKFCRAFQYLLGEFAQFSELHNG